jgi:hypothetical protein
MLFVLSAGKLVAGSSIVPRGLRVVYSLAISWQFPVGLCETRFKKSHTPDPQTPQSPRSLRLVIRPCTSSSSDSALVRNEIVWLAHEDL